MEVERVFSAGVWSISNVSVATANTALAVLKYTPTANYDLDASAEIVITDADNASISDTMILDLSPENEAPTATNTDQTLEFDEDASTAPFASIVITEVDTIQASTDLTTASDDASAETVSVTITLSDITAGSFSVDSGNGEDFTAGIWSISNVSVGVANDALDSLYFVPTARLRFGCFRGDCHYRC